MNKEKLLQAIKEKPIPRHIAIIMDGNGRWASRKGLPRIMGHQKGMKTLYEAIQTARALGVANLTVFAFSTENWARPQDEVDYLMNAFLEFYRKHHQKMLQEKTRVQIIGEKKQLPIKVADTIEEIERTTKDFTGLTFTVAFNYGSRQEIIHMVKEIATKVANHEILVHNIDETLIEQFLYTKNLYPIDLVIRTSGEERISNFLLWQIAYSELYFPKTLWPDFHTKDLYEAIYEYQGRNRRFGGLENKA